MSDTVQKPVLNEALNGVKAPLYFDRQVVRASDLMLDRQSHDEELARMRRLLHGWGIVSGLDVISKEDSLSVGRGYGVTPTGEEVFLRERLEVNNLARHIWGCCGPDAVGCELIDEVEIRRRIEEEQSATVTSWLIARPMKTLGEPRPGVAEGCAHPANKLLPTRSCDGVRLELLCNLPPPHDAQPPRCEDLSPLICQQSVEDKQPFLAMPEAYRDELSFLVLCLLRCQVEDGELAVTMHPANRRSLLPVSVLQQFLTACICPVLAQPQPPIVEDPPPVAEDEPEPGDDGGTIHPPGRRVDWDDLRGKLREEELLQDPDSIIPDDGVTDPPRFREEFEFIDDAQVISHLGDIGVSGPDAFIATDATVIAEATGLEISVVRDAQRALDNVNHLFSGPRF